MTSEQNPGTNHNGRHLEAPVIKDGVELWVVKKVLNVTQKYGVVSYETLWAEKNMVTWEPIDSFPHRFNSQVLRDYQKRHPKRWADVHQKAKNFRKKIAKQELKKRERISKAKEVEAAFEQTSNQSNQNKKEVDEEPSSKKLKFRHLLSDDSDEDYDPRKQGKARKDIMDMTHKEGQFFFKTLWNDETTTWESIDKFPLKHNNFLVNRFKNEYPKQWNSVRGAAAKYREKNRKREQKLKKLQDVGSGTDFPMFTGAWEKWPAVNEADSEEKESIPSGSGTDEPGQCVNQDNSTSQQSQTVYKKTGDEESKLFHHIGTVASALLPKTNELFQNS
uniref:Chromo domain-containing protein n=1 Tax=Caenorhabditis tropicalis TaxID=1561998 RepID=A0A1I7TZ85_9PELO